MLQSRATLLFFFFKFRELTVKTFTSIPLKLCERMLVEAFFVIKEDKRDR